MTSLAALFYADARSLLNGARGVMRSPGRLVLWTLYTVGFGFFVVVRLGLRFHRTPTNDDFAADTVVCGLLMLLAAGLLGVGAGGAFFRSLAEARFIISSPVAAPLAIAYIQIRASLSLGRRFLLLFLYFFAILAPRASLSVILFDLLLVVAVFFAASAILIPRRLVSGVRAMAATLVGYGVGLIAVAFMVRLFVASTARLDPPQVTSVILHWIPPWHPGSVLLEPHLEWIVAALALAAAAVGVLAAAGRDAYPELYALSIAHIERTGRIRARLRGVRAELHERQHRPSVRVSLAAPPGVLIFLWKTLIEVRRRSKRAFIIGGALVWLIVGARLALWANFLAALNGGTHSDHVSDWRSQIPLVLILVLGRPGPAIGTLIASEIRRPLFWLSDAIMFERLAALVIAYSLRFIITVELVAVGFICARGPLAGGLVLVLALPALIVLLTSICFASYALFPIPVDQTGPKSLLQSTLTSVAMIPLIAVAIGPGILFQESAIAVCAGSVLSIIEASAFIGIAAWRLDGRIDRLVATRR